MVEVLAGGLGGNRREPGAAVAVGAERAREYVGLSANGTLTLDQALPFQCTSQ